MPRQPAPKTLPSYADLKSRRDGKPPGSAWGVFGEGDDIGTINLLDADRVLAGIREVRLGEVHSLNWDVTEPSPNPHRPAPVRTHIVAPGIARDDSLSPFPLQYSSQWDGLRHVEVGGRFYNDVDPARVDDPASTTLGIQLWAERGIVGRGVLLDVAGHQAAKGTPFDPGSRFEIRTALLDEVAAAQGTSIERGDILLLRTGWAGWFQSLPPAERARRFQADSPQAGLEPVEASAAWLWDKHVAAVAADNVALESMPVSMETTDGFLHFKLIPALGLAVGELFWLDDLAAACRADRRWSFFFTSAPLNVPGGVGSPPNALAIR